jgi:tetratricopeptide (TPR) repeat protein
MGCAVAAVYVYGTCRMVSAQNASYVAPPRTIADITAVLDQEKPNPAKTAQRRREADAEPPTGGGNIAQAQFHFKRGQARSELGRIDEAIADLEKAIAVNADPQSELTNRIRQNLVLQYGQAGELKRATPLLETMVQEYDHPGTYGRLFSTYRW